MWTILLYVMIPVYIVSCLFLILVILGQEGKGGGLSGLMGSSALGDTLGASAAESTLRRWTRNCAIVFVSLSLLLTIVGSQVFTGGASRLEQTARQLPPASQQAPEESATSPTVTPAAQQQMATPPAVTVAPQQKVTTASVGQQPVSTAPAKPAPTVPASATPSTKATPSPVAPKPVPATPPPTRSP